MKPQKKATVAQKAPKSPTVANKRRTLNDKLSIDTKNDKKLKKIDKTDEVKKKLEFEKKRLERSKKIEEKKKLEDSKKREKIERIDDKKKLLKEMEKKIEAFDEKKVERSDKTDDSTNEGSQSQEKKKSQKIDDKQKQEKQSSIDVKKKFDKFDEKKKLGKEETSETASMPNSPISEESKSEEKVETQVVKKKLKDEKKKDCKVIKSDCKETKSNAPTKDKKIDKKLDISKTKPKAPVVKKDNKPKKLPAKKTVVAKKCPLSKKLIEKKLKLVKSGSSKEDNSSPEDSDPPKSKKKNLLLKSKILPEKKPKLAKQMKAKLPPKNGKLNNVLKKEKLKKITEKIVKKKLDIKETDKTPEPKKIPDDSIAAEEIKKELPDDEESAKPLEPKKSPKLPPKSKAKKPTKKQVKPSKSLEEDDKSSPKPEDLSVKSEDAKSPSAKRDRPESPPKLDLKQEMTPSSSGSDSPPSSTDSDHDYVDASERRNKHKKRQDRDSSPNDERARRMRLFGFWSGPKRHRVASLNALAKVHCLYENEAGGVYLGGFCKPKPEKDKSKKPPPPVKDDKEKEEPAVRKETKDKKPDVSGKAETDNTSKRNLRNVPGLRGKHWDMMECTSSSSSSSDDDSGERNDRNVKRGRKKNTTRRKKPEEVMDLKDMVVCKRMASLNASAILAASYSDEKNRQTSSDESEESESSEVEIIKRRKHIDNDSEKRKGRQINDEDVLKPGKKVVIVNQDTDVTITGVYVNQTRSTHHEGFCSIAGMQYRISSTSHTQTAATAVATELHEQKVEQPCKSYTPLGALSSMQPPGSQGSHPNMSPRRHSAFSAPHQHGYYQPAGPLIQHPPTLPPVKGPPPEPTPTPPQNSEGSDDLVATSTTSGGTNSTGNTWRSYPKSESRLTTTAIPSTSILPTGGGFYRAYCPQYYGTPPQYQELCYPPTYPHPHSHPPPYYKYAPAYRRQYYSYPESGGGAGGPSVPTGAPVVEYQPPPPPGDYPMPPYYGGYPPPPPPPPPPPNPAYLHAQGRALVDHATFQGCPCPMQSCSKNVDTGPLIGNGKGAPVASGPGLSLPPSALVGPPSPARGLAGLAPPHGANAWDTDRVQLNTIRNLNHSQSITTVSNNNKLNNDNNCISVIEKLDKCTCTKLSCTSTCEVKQETLSPNDNTQELQKSTTNIQLNDTIKNYKIENNNVKCESCSVVDNVLNDNLTTKLSSSSLSSSSSPSETSSSGTSSCTANCNVKCEENNYKCELIKCEECIKEGQIAILEIDKDSGILLIDDKIDDNSVKEEINDVGGGGDDGGGRGDDNWNKPDYEATVDEQVDDEVKKIIGDLPNCGRVGKRKLSLDSLSDSPKKKKVDKRTLSVGSTRDDENGGDNRCIDEEIKLKKKSQVKRKAEEINLHESNSKKIKNGKNGVLNCLKNTASETSIMETINNVIQQSLLMTKKKEGKTTAKCKDKIDVKKKSVNLMSIIKKVPKTIVNAVVNDKLQLKTEGKLIKDTGLNKFESKIKGKVFDGKNKCHNKIKNNNNNKIHDVKINDLMINEFDVVDSGIGNFDGKFEDTKRVALGTRKKKSTKKGNTRKNGKNEENNAVSENFILVKRPFLKPKWSNGWSWEGESYEAKVYLTNEESAIRRCYAAMRHVSGDVLRPRDCVLLKSGQRKADLPFVAKIAALWENPDDGEMMFSLLWYYRPEHTEQGRTDYDTEDEVFASRHRDANSVACIEDKCYILTFNEYCRYRKNLRRMEEGLECPGLIVPPGDHKYPRESRQPPIPVPSDMVLFCRRVYDYRGKKLVKNPG